MYLYQVCGKEEKVCKQSLGNRKIIKGVCFCETNFDVFTIFSVLFMEIYTPMETSDLFLTKYQNIRLLGEKGEKSYLITDS